MLLGVIRGAEARGKPRRFGIGHLAQRSGYRGLDLLSLADNGANLEALVLRTEEDLVLVQAEESLRSILTRCVSYSSVRLGSRDSMRDIPIDSA